MTNHPNRGPGPFTLKDVPLSVLNRALELQGHEPAPTRGLAFNVLRQLPQAPLAGTPYTAFGQAVAEYLSQAGPWAPTGPHAGKVRLEFEG